MRTSIKIGSSIIVLAATAWTTAAQAQWAVVDAPAIVQLIEEVRTLEQQLEVARQQLQSAQQSVRQLSGDRGMSSLLAGSSWNYLPPNWAEVTRLGGNGPTAFPGLSRQIQADMTANAVLTPAQMSALPVAQRSQIESERRWIAADSALARAALAGTSQRFDSLQTLVSALSRATDAKATLDLQARIAAELAMLQNEQTKFQALGRALDAEGALLRQRGAEYAIDARGRFAARFEPTP